MSEMPVVATIMISVLAALFLGTTLYLGVALLKQEQTYARAVIEADRQARADVDRLWAARIADVDKKHEAEIERLQNMKTVGVAIPAEAKVFQETVDPEARIQREISEDTIVRGAQAILDEHKQLGIPMTEAEARAQAESALLQGSFAT